MTPIITKKPDHSKAVNPHNQPLNRSPQQRSPLLLIGLMMLAIISLILALLIGSLSIDANTLMHTLLGEDTGMSATVIWELRLPRATAAFITGGMLALAGCLMQVLLRNPLADPYVLGISGGAAVAALSAMLMGLSGFWLSGSALMGALLSMMLVFGLARGQGGWTPTRLLLSGIVIAAGWGAVISFLLTISPDQHMRGMLFWLMGDLSHSRGSMLTAALLIIALIFALALARPLNLLTRGEMQAAALGVNIKPLRLTLYVLASLLTASAVTQAGSIGFIGLVVPHLLRLMGMSDHRLLIPACVLLGGTLLVLADTLARSLLAPQQLPVGVITALLGVPLFLYLLNRGPRDKTT